MPTLDPSVGGVGPAVTALSRGIAGRGHTVDILALDDPGAPWLKLNGLNIFAIGRGLTGYQYSPQLRRWLREHGAKYNRIIVNGLWQYPNLAVWQEFARTSTPYYVFPHGMLDPWFKRTYPLKHLKKWCYWPWAEYRVLRDAAAVIFTSEQERIDARQSFWLYRSREKVSPLGIPLPSPVMDSAGDVFQRFPQIANRRVLLFLGRLHPKKGCDTAIEALAGMSKRDNVVLVFAGPDQVGWQRQLQTRATALGLAANVVFTGMLDGETKQAVLAAADALILPSHQENFGISVIEALAAGVPVLISNRINIWREIESDRAGYVANDDVGGTRSLLERWIETPSELWAAMGRNARQCFARRFEINRAVNSLLEILLAKPAASPFVGRN